ncbi:hypothetical protein FNV43_RR10353 [Rhamnella rubrinervis]|uniref:TIR domain-containing protein n=1 Tax=Rhamnella rubrinervis TaxID=2594499 RepID=A0A8K0HBQ1_9ROSA|nr:hypothetical protein FNV43_RR10353 [Rhamnella rubrinervis]
METNPSPAKTFDVFLSFRGEDTRYNFTGHLSHALRRIGLFNIFKDEYALEKGKNIELELMKAIEDSQYAVVVLSENYAGSDWCLKELAKIVECMGNSGRIRTIFYHVNPSHVRAVKSTDVEKQKESSFCKALKDHAKNPSHSKDLESWRNALYTVSYQEGYPLKLNQTDEASFIEKFVADISRKIGASIRNIDDLFGMSSRLLQLDKLVLQSFATNRVCFVGIHGMGGIGKSTLARAYYKRMSHKFHGCSFLENVREVCKENAKGLVNLQKQLLSNILEGDFEQIGHSDYGRDMIKSRLRSKKVLIVLDDVSKMDQLYGLAWEHNWFGSESIILVTTREESFLNIGKYTIYRAESLNPSEALQLFSSKAFRSIEPPGEYKDLSEQAVKYACYLPLALTVLGSHLGSKRERSEWESALRRLENYPEMEIVDKLKISFDDLNKIEQCIFLDIACFFTGFDRDYVIDILDCCGFESLIGIRDLTEKSLLSIQDGSKLRVHDLLKEMAREIVRGISDKEQLHRGSRIWNKNELYKILEVKEGMNEVEAIVTHLDETMEYSFEALPCMKKLRLLKIAADFRLQYDCEGPELSKMLAYVDWSGFPYSKLPSSFRPFDLVQLKLQNSNIKKLWNNDIKPLYKLKVIDLSNSQFFTEFEDFKVFPNLEKLILQGCGKMSVIHPSITLLNKLVVLNLEFCTSLKKFPEGINHLASLQTLKLVGCLELKELPVNLEQLKSLRKLEIDASVIKSLPISIFHMENLQSLYYGKLWSCTELK